MSALWTGLIVPPGCIEDTSTALLHFDYPEAAIERLAAAPTVDGFAARDIWLLRLRALLAQAHDDAATYAHLRDRYRDMAKTLDFDGHIAWAEAMP